MLTTEQGMMVRMPINDQLRVIGRATQGVRLINLRGEDHVVDASLIIGGEDDIEEVDEDPTNPIEPVEPATQDSESEGTEEDSE